MNTQTNDLEKITALLKQLVKESKFENIYEFITLNSCDHGDKPKSAYFGLLTQLVNGKFPSKKQNGSDTLNPFLNFPNVSRDNRGSTWKNLQNTAFYFLKGKAENKTTEKTIEEKTNEILAEIGDLKIDNLCDAFVWLRQSIKRKEFEGRHNVMGNTLMKFAESLGYKKIHKEFQQDLSGFDSHKRIIAILSLPNMESMFAGTIDRIARNLEGYMMVTQYAYDNHKKIYLNSTCVSEGTGYISGLVQAIFGEFDLLSKQTSFSHYMEEVALFLTGKIIKSEMTNPKAIKLITLARFVDRIAFMEKLEEKAIGIMEKFDSKEKNKNGTLKVSKELNEVAKKVLETIYEK